MGAGVPVSPPPDDRHGSDGDELQFAIFLPVFSIILPSQAAANEGKSSAVNGERSSFDLLALQQVY